MNRVTWILISCGTIAGIAGGACSSSSTSTGGSSTSNTSSSGGSTSTTSTSGGTTTSASTTTASTTSASTTSASTTTASTTTASTSASTTSASTTSASTTTASTTSSSSGATTCSGATPVTLTVVNADTWCSVSVAGGTASPGASQQVCVAANSTVTVDATALSGFMLGTTPWHDVDGDTGSGVQGTLSGSGATQQSEAMVTVTTADKCVWVCCPSSTEPCPTTEQCL